MARYERDENSLRRTLVRVYPEDLVNGFFEIPYCVTKIGTLAFNGCTGLTSVAIHYGVREIGNIAFSGHHGLTSLVIPDSVTTIGRFAFANCTGLTSLVIPGSMMTIGLGAFSGCTGLTSVVIPNSVTTIGINAFSGCSNLQVIAIDAEGDEFERIKSLLPDDLQSKVLSVDEYNQIKAIQVKVCESYLAERAPRLLPASIWGIVGSLSADMKLVINTVPLPNPNEESWRESYHKMLSEALSNTELLAAVSPSERAEVRETKRQSPAVASRVGLFSSKAVSDNSHLETKMPDEPSPRPAP